MKKTLLQLQFLCYLLLNIFFAPALLANNYSEKESISEMNPSPGFCGDVVIIPGRY